MFSFAKQEHEFKCSGPVERTGSECSAEPQCPHPCRCADGIVDCRENSLTKVPTHLPEDTTELFVIYFVTNHRAEFAKYLSFAFMKLDNDIIKLV